MKLSDIKPQMRVIYTPFKGCAADQLEIGKVSSTNHLYAFVKFDRQVSRIGWEGTTSQSCLPEDLEPMSQAEVVA